jgi:hypothetical protein
MDWLKYFFSKGAKNTISLKGGTNFSYVGPWVKLAALPIETRLDRWHLGEFCAVEYSIVADYDTFNREIIKCIVTAGKDLADVTIYGRSNLGAPILDITATVNASYVDIIARPSQEDSTELSGAKVLYQATYFKTINPPV